MTNDDRMQQESSLIATIKMTRNSCCFTKTPLPPITKSEYALLGMAIKIRWPPWERSACDREE
jgi:hypothetical protein